MRFIDKGFSLIEIMFTAGILALVLCGLLLIYINLFLLGDISRQLTLATNATQAKMEEIRNTNFDSLANLNGTTFDIDGFSVGNAKGVIEVTDTAYTDLKRVRLVVSFRQKGERIIGEDKNFNGSLDIGEDTNANGRLDSPVEMVSLIAK